MSDNARDQAIAQVESIVAMVAALEVDYDRLEELREEFDALEGREKESAILGKLEYPGDVTTSVDNELIYAYDLGRELAELEDAAGDCSDEEEALERIQDDPLSIEFRSDWCSLGDEMTPSEARIVLCTGGPHVEILCDLDRGQPSRPRVIYKDWGTSGELFDFDHDAVTRYLEQLYFGE